MIVQRRNPHQAVPAGGKSEYRFIFNGMEKYKDIS